MTKTNRQECLAWSLDIPMWGRMASRLASWGGSGNPPGVGSELCMGRLQSAAGYQPALQGFLPAFYSPNTNKACPEVTAIHCLPSTANDIMLEYISAPVW